MARSLKNKDENLTGHKRVCKQYHHSIFAKVISFKHFLVDLFIQFLPHLSVTNPVPVSLHQKSAVLFRTCAL